MLYYDHFFGAYRNIYLDYDYLREVDGHDELPIRFTRLKASGEHDVAKTIAPACEKWNVHGFDENEAAKLRDFLADNLDALLAEAESTRGQGDNLVEMSFELSTDELIRVLCASYLSGKAPGEFVQDAMRDAIEYYKQEFPEMAKESDTETLE